MCERANECVSESRNFSRIGCTLRKRSMQKFMQIGTEIRERCRIIILSFNKSDTQIKPPSPVYLLCTWTHSATLYPVNTSNCILVQCSIHIYIYIWLQSLDELKVNGGNDGTRCKTSTQIDLISIQMMCIYLFDTKIIRCQVDWNGWKCLQHQMSVYQIKSNQIKSNRINSKEVFEIHTQLAICTRMPNN